MIRNEIFLEKAKNLEPKLLEKLVAPVEGTVLSKDGKDSSFTTGDRIIYDFGNHYTGYFSVDLDYEGHHPDAPVWLRISFAEQLCEFEEDAESYKGWISKGWIQQEQLHVDVIPDKLELPRRYAFRYAAVEVLDCSNRYRVKFENPRIRAVSSADDSQLLPYVYGKNQRVSGESRERGLEEQEKIRKLEAVATRTLHECMQRVFEDGPKRDRRLWMGDLRLEALANYETYKQNDMVKRCLYLFAGDRLDNGMIAANLFLDPKVEADDQAMLDYALFFVTSLRDYVRETEDLEILKDLYPVAIDQLQVMETYFEGSQVIRDQDTFGWVFVDWNMQLNRQASAQGICLYALQAGMELAGLMEDQKQVALLQESYEKKRRAARDFFFDADLQVFVSGDAKEISWASQCWLIIGGAVDAVEGAKILEKTEELEKAGKPVQNMVTPYMYHHYIEALLLCEQREKALDVMLYYWGGMLDQGADTFWELYNPKNPQESPYGGTIVNSYCHAWSCAPTYFLRKYF